MKTNKKEPYWKECVLGPSTIKAINDCSCGHRAKLYHAWNTTFQVTVFNFHCDGCDKGLGQYQRIESAIERWNYHHPKKQASSSPT